MDDNNYITIQGWMRTKLGLKGNDLLVYAIIYGFSQTEGQRFTGNLQYLADWCGATKQGILKNLKNLTESGLIRKYECEKNGIKCCEYSLIPLNSVEWGIKLSLTNNINNNINNTVLSKDNTTAEKTKKPNLYTKCISAIEDFTDDSTIQSSLKEWLNMLLEKYRVTNRQLYINVFKSKLKMLEKFDQSEWKDIIEYNTQRGYEGFYPMRNYYNQRQANVGVSNETYTDRELDKLDEVNEERRKRGMRVEF